MVLNVVLEQVFKGIGEGVVRLDFYFAEVLAYRNAIGAEHLAVGEFVNLPHEAAGIVAKGVVALLELVQLFYYGNGNYNIVVLKLADCPVVMQDDVSV